VRLVWLVMLGLTACSTGLSARDKTGTDFPTDAGEDTGTTPDTGATPDDNRAPIADAGDDRTGMVTDEIQLDGSSSFDPDGDTLDFLWEFVETPAGSAAFLINETRDDASFYADRPGTYVVELLIDDGQATDTDAVQVTVESPNEGPVANAGPDQNVDVGDRVVLNGAASYDPDDDPLSFTWNLVSAPGGSGAVLDDPSSALPQFTADLAGTYVIELQVTDGADVSPTDAVRVVAQNQDDSDCLSCATAEAQLRRRYSVGDATSGAGLLLLPLLLLGIQRKRLMARED
jgi:hypothetical protein